ncbi:hypothetical protein PRIPAC_88650 [Pristionchus pacificus]|nr:hypothetical protein PRIPAC_88650 [Pristionchus pacificus]
MIRSPWTRRPEKGKALVARVGSWFALLVASRAFGRFSPLCREGSGRARRIGPIGRGGRSEWRSVETHIRSLISD